MSSVSRLESDLEAGGDGGVLIVCSLRVSYQIIPAGEHLPAEGEFSLLRSITSFICITSHPGKKRHESHRGQIREEAPHVLACLSALRLTFL